MNRRRLSHLPRKLDSVSGLSYTQPNSLAKGAALAAFSHQEPRPSAKGVALQPKAWVAAAIGTVALIKVYKNSVGPASLEQMAWRTLLCNLGLVDDELLESLDWKLAHQIWTRIEQNQLVSNKIWMAYVETHRAEILEGQHDGLIIRNSPRLPLLVKDAFTPSINEYLKLVTSLNSSWITILSLFHHRPRSPQDWIRLALLENLGALWIESEGPNGDQLNETVIKEWADLCKPDDDTQSHVHGFRSLRFLRISRRGHFDLERTDILNSLALFPALRVFNLSSWSTYLDLLKLRGHGYWHAGEASRLCQAVRAKVISQTIKHRGALTAWKIIAAFDDDAAAAVAGGPEQQDGSGDVDERAMPPLRVPLLCVEGIADDKVTWVRNDAQPRYNNELWFERRQDLPVQQGVVPKRVPQVKPNLRKNVNSLLGSVLGF